RRGRRLARGGGDELARDACKRVRADARSAMTLHEWRRDAYVISTDRARQQLDVIQGFLARSYWSPAIPREVVHRALEPSLPFGVFHGDEQVGYARVVTDQATFAWICDVFVIEEHRGRGLSKWLIECVRATPELQGLRRWLLATRDAHGLYARFGFV